MNADKIIQCILVVMLKLEKAVNSTIEAVQDKLDRGGYTGTAQDLDDEIQNLKNPDAVLKSVTPTITGLNISAPADSYAWRINQVVFGNTPVLAETLTPASDGFYRKDALLGTNTNTYLIIEGVEGDESVTAPTVFPLGTILLGVIDIFGNIKNTTPTLQNVFDVTQSGSVVRGNNDLRLGTLLYYTIFGTGGVTICDDSANTRTYYTPTSIQVVNSTDTLIIQYPYWFSGTVVEVMPISVNNNFADGTGDILLSDASGTFTSADGKTITVTNGVIESII